MLLSLIQSLRDIIGIPEFYLADGSINYGAVTEYFICGLLVLVVVGSVFKCLVNFTK